MLQRIPIKWKITILSFGLILFSLLIVGITLVGNTLHVQEDELGQRMLVTARTVAQLPPVIEDLSSSTPSFTINTIVDRLRIINNMDYIVVMDMNGRIFTHPLTERLGTVSKGSDERSAFAEHTYISKSKGDLGTALRAFVPIINEHNIQVGVVLVGKVLPSLWDVLDSIQEQIYLTIIVSLFFGVWGSWFLAQHIKKQMFQLEPQELARILSERTATFNAIQEGIIAIDNKDIITIVNDTAMQMLGLTNDSIGLSLRNGFSSQRFADQRFIELIEIRQQVYNRELQVGSKILLYNRIPIQLQQKIVGAILIFHDRTEVTTMAEELTGVKAFVEALRVQNHEFMNKLHTIGGLIQLNHNERALEFLFEITEERKELTRFLGSRIFDESLAGLLLAKVSRGRELGIDVVIDRQSRLERYPNLLDHHDFVILLGNLLENAFDAVKYTEQKQIFISIGQDLDVLLIQVEDTGCGIDAEVQPLIFAKGFTTKEGTGRGFGMYLIQSIIEKGKGSIEIDTIKGEGTSFLISFPMEI